MTALEEEEVVGGKVTALFSASLSSPIPCMKISWIKFYTESIGKQVK